MVKLREHFVIDIVTHKGQFHDNWISSLERSQFISVEPCYLSKQQKLLTAIWNLNTKTLNILFGWLTSFEYIKLHIGIKKPLQTEIFLFCQALKCKISFCKWLMNYEAIYSSQCIRFSTFDKFHLKDFSLADLKQGIGSFE